MVHRCRSILDNYTKCIHLQTGSNICNVFVLVVELHLLMLFALPFSRYSISLNADELFMYIIWLNFGHIKGVIK